MESPQIHLGDGELAADAGRGLGAPLAVPTPPSAQSARQIVAAEEEEEEEKAYPCSF